MTKEAHKALKKLLGTDGYTANMADREVMSYDSFDRDYWPEAVASPTTTEQVAGVIRLANEHGFTVTPRGSGSGRSGGSLPIKGGLVMSLVRMNAILEIDSNDMIARVEPGVITADLQQAVEEVGLFYPPDPASHKFSTLGGNLAECAGGIRAVKYGVTRDYVLGVTAVTGSGTIVKAGTRTIKGVVGYDLSRLLVGSEGTLGIITEATVKLLPKPQAKSTLIGLFPSVNKAANAVVKVFKSGVLPVAMEFMDRNSMEVVADKLPMELEDGDQAMLLAETDGNVLAVADDAQRIAKAFESLNGRVVMAHDPNEIETMWAARRGISIDIKKYKPYKIAEDVAVPRSKLPQMLKRLDEIAQRAGLYSTSYGHAGDGNCHVNILFETEDERPAANRAVKEVLQAALDLGGTLSGEHGVGTAKAPFIHWELSAEELDLMLQLKKVFDPKGILNPGKIFTADAVAKATQKAV